MTKKIESFSISCPAPSVNRQCIEMAHGGGGKRMHELIDQIFRPAFQSRPLDTQHDGALLSLPSSVIAMTTDSYVVKPIFFKGGDIGKMAVFGTVNDLAMCGAKPLYMTAAFILEEGFLIEDLKKITHSMALAAKRCGVEIVTGDIKVVDRGKGDQIFINTAGVGAVMPNLCIVPANIAPGDQIVLSGDIGRHGVAVMAQREGLEFETTLESDLAPLHGLVGRWLEENIEIHCLRDLTRGGLATALNEISRTRNLEIEIHEDAIPVTQAVQGACEILGLDPLYVANEGRLIAFVPKTQLTHCLQIAKTDAHGTGAVWIGEVKENSGHLVTMKTALGSNRVLDMLSGEQLPRIC